MRSVVFVVPGRLNARTGGSIYDRRMTEGLRQHGWTVEVRELDGTFPFPTPATLGQAASELAAIADGRVVVIDGLALGAIADVVVREASRLRIVALVHLPLAADVSIDRGRAAALASAERRTFQASALIVVTGTATLPMLTRYDLPRERITVVEPGTDYAPVAQGSQGAWLQIVCVATLQKGKGHEILLRALASVPGDRWRLTCAGSLTREAATSEHLRSTARSLGLEERVSFVGELDPESLSTLYDGADVFVLATLQETYGMAVAEALARGLPVVSTTTGAIPALVGDDAGLLAQPGDTEALAAALTRVIGDAAFRARLAAGARRVRERLASWDDAARDMSAALAPLADPTCANRPSSQHG